MRNQPVVNNKPTGLIRDRADEGAGRVLDGDQGLLAARSRRWQQTSAPV
jgi:hypothetical protein